jgi:hypothetical protein
VEERLIGLVGFAHLCTSAFKLVPPTFSLLCSIG